MKLMMNQNNLMQFAECDVVFNLFLQKITIFKAHNFIFLVDTGGFYFSVL